MRDWTSVRKCGDSRALPHVIPEKAGIQRRYRPLHCHWISAEALSASPSPPAPLPRAGEGSGMQLRRV
ncbi:hypothetical protein GCM10025770_36600 [Viridibacterium curvum]|uniref:Uncharacterized protein n=1 Tax=Viridibacterium curvum TaxID=1101404 RepID=A0ABP9R4E6_9RHOO